MPVVLQIQAQQRGWRVLCLACFLNLLWPNLPVGKFKIKLDSTDPNSRLFIGFAFIGLVNQKVQDGHQTCFIFCHLQISFKLIIYNQGRNSTNLV